MDGSGWVIVPVLGIIAPMTMVVLVVWAIARGKQQQARYRAEVQSKMIEKFGSAPEFAEFLSSPAGRQFVGESQVSTASSAHDRIFSGVKWSLILSLLGIAFLVARVAGEDRDLIIPGSILLGLGVALCISTVVSYRLSRSWGLIKPVDSSSDAPTANS